jgi:hypothetical protein
MLQLCVFLESLVVSAAQRSRSATPRRLRGCAGQTTAEYALVMLGAAAIAALVVTWASKSDVVGKLFNFALSKVMGAVK